LHTVYFNILQIKTFALISVKFSTFLSRCCIGTLVSNAFLSHAGGAACPPPMYVGSHSLPERAVPHRCRTSRRVIGRRAVRIFKESTSSKNLRHQSRPVPGTGQHRLRSRTGSLSLGTPRFLRVTTPHTRARTHHTRTHAHTLVHTRSGFLLPPTFPKPRPTEDVLRPSRRGILSSRPASTCQATRSRLRPYTQSACCSPNSSANDPLCALDSGEAQPRGCAGGPAPGAIEP
jgi:hypothetical protein